MKDSHPPPQPVLAIDIGGTKLAAGLVTPDGEIHLPITVPTQAAGGGEAVMRRVIALAMELIRRSAAAPGLAPQAVGVGTGGKVILGEGAILSATTAMPGWTGMPVRRRLAEATGLPVEVENDGNVMALGEALFGAGRGRSLVVGITVGTGIGGGIVIDRRIFHGAHGFSNHIGHLIVNDRGRPCPCGRTGCLEAYASAPAMVSDFRRRVGRSRLQSELGLDLRTLGVKEIARLAQSGLPEAIAALRSGAHYLGIGIATLFNLLDPDIVVVGGGAAQSGEVYFSAVEATARQRALPGTGDIPIVPAGLNTGANLVGAACLVWSKSM